MGYVLLASVSNGLQTTASSTVEKTRENEEEEEKKKNRLRVCLLHTSNFLFQNQTNKAGLIAKQIHQLGQMTATTVYEFSWNVDKMSHDTKDLDKVPC
jgi:hypothetical protein